MRALKVVEQIAEPEISEAESWNGRLQMALLAPNGVQKLRELVLELAMRGKLVPQDSKDEPASEFLRRIRTGNHKIHNKKIKKLQPISGDPYDLPKSWAWARLGEVTTFGTTEKAGNIAKDTWVLDLEDIEKDTSRLIQKVRFKERSAKSNKNSFCSQDVLYGKLRPYLNKVIIADEDGVCTTEIIPIRWREKADSKFLMYVLKRPDFLSYVNSKSYGMKMPRLGTEDGINALIPVAPIAEQYRISAKIDELMALCDQLEAQKSNAANAHEILVKALLGTLTQSQNAKEFQENWQRIAKNFNILFTTEASIDALKQTILQLAVMGKLVPQNSKDESATKLLERIKSEKEKLIKAGKIKKDKPLPEIAGDEKPYNIPDNWQWARMQDISSLITDGTHQTPKYTDTGRPFLSAQNVKPFKFMPENHRYVSEDDYQDYIRNKKAEKNDVLLTRVGAMIGEAAVIDKDIDFAFYVSLGLIKPMTSYIDANYLVLWLNSPVGTASSIKNTLGRGVSAGNLNLSLIRGFVVSLPPEKEQKRIVAKVNELVAFCDDLKDQLIKFNSTHENLASALVEKAIVA